MCVCVCVCVCVSCVVCRVSCVPQWLPRAARRLILLLVRQQVQAATRLLPPSTCVHDRADFLACLCTSLPRSRSDQALAVVAVDVVVAAVVVAVVVVATGSVGEPRFVGSGANAW